MPLPEFVVDALGAHLAAFPASDDGLIFQADKGGLVRNTVQLRCHRCSLVACLVLDG